MYPGSEFHHNSCGKTAVDSHGILPLKPLEQGDSDEKRCGIYFKYNY
jgi:hypothetical protein